MSVHPYVYCKTCLTVQPFFYDFDNMEWVCFVCGQAGAKPEDELEKLKKLRVKRAL